MLDNEIGTVLFFFSLSAYVRWLSIEIRYPVTNYSCKISINHLVPQGANSVAHLRIKYIFVFSNNFGIFSGKTTLQSVRLFPRSKNSKRMKTRPQILKLHLPVKSKPLLSRSSRQLRMHRNRRFRRSKEPRLNRRLKRSKPQTRLQRPLREYKTQQLPKLVWA